MDRRELILRGGGAAAGLVLGVANANEDIVYAKGQSGEGDIHPFGRFKNELLVDGPANSFHSIPSDSVQGRSTHKSVPPRELGDQFFVFQLTPTKQGKWYIRSPQEVEPSLETSEEYPDVVLDSRLVSFHIGLDEEMDRETKATVRITFGSDQSTDRARSMGENLYWGITSGINLWNQRGMQAEPRELRSDFREAFGNKFVELPGGAGTLKVEIVKHRNSSWWEKVFDFSTSIAGRSMISALGFPGVTSRVLHFVDEAANRLVGDNAKVIFSSRGLPIAFSKQSKDEIAAMGTRIGCLKTGIWIFARGRDLPVLSAEEMTYDATLRRLFPAKSNIADILSGKARDPLGNVTYAVLQTHLKQRRISVGF